MIGPLVARARTRFVEVAAYEVVRSQDFARTILAWARCDVTQASEFIVLHPHKRGLSR